jgi:hypothetical protein
MNMLDEIKQMETPEYLTLLDSAYRAHADRLEQSADDGTDMHADLEEYVKTCLLNDGVPLPPNPTIKSQPVQIFGEWAVREVSKFLVSEGHCFSKKLWTGGITDCICELKNGQYAIIDFKSSKEAYLSQFIQAAGYDLAVKENGVFDAEGKLLLKIKHKISCYIIFPFGMSKVEPQFHYDVKGAKKGFAAAVILYKLINQ